MLCKLGLWFSILLIFFIEKKMRKNVTATQSELWQITVMPIFKNCLKKTCFCLFSMLFFFSFLCEKQKFQRRQINNSQNKIGSEPTTCSINQTNVQIKRKVKTRICFFFPVRISDRRTYCYVSVLGFPKKFRNLKKMQMNENLFSDL